MDLVRRMLNEDPKKRITAAEVLDNSRQSEDLARFILARAHVGLARARLKAKKKSSVLYSLERTLSSLERGRRNLRGRVILTRARVYSARASKAEQKFLETRVTLARAHIMESETRAQTF